MTKLEDIAKDLWAKTGIAAQTINYDKVKGVHTVGGSTPEGLQIFYDQWGIQEDKSFGAEFLIMVKPSDAGNLAVKISNSVVSNTTETEIAAYNFDSIIGMYDNFDKALLPIIRNTPILSEIEKTFRQAQSTFPSPVNQIASFKNAYPTAHQEVTNTAYFFFHGLTGDISGNSNIQ